MEGVIPMDRKEENEKKKEYLRSYRKHGSRIKRIEAELEEIRLMKMNPSVRNGDGMPRGSSQQDLSEYVAQLESLEDQLYRKGVEQVTAYKEIEAAINKIEDENQRDVLFYRYIKGMDWWNICRNMGFSERQIHRIHGRALNNLKI